MDSSGFSTAKVGQINFAPSETYSLTPLSFYNIDSAMFDRLSNQFLLYFSVILNGRAKVDMSDFEMLKLLGTGGELFRC